MRLHTELGVACLQDFHPLDGPSPWKIAVGSRQKVTGVGRGGVLREFAMLTVFS